MRILLINPYVPLEILYGKAFSSQGAVLPPLGLLYLASYLKTKGVYTVEILDANALKNGPGEIEKYIAKNKFDCIGLSATSLAYPYAVEIAKLIRKISPQTTIALGGPHAQGNYKGIMEGHPELFDFACYGEGEYAFESLLEYKNGKVPKDRLLGLAYIEEGKIVLSQPAPIPALLDVFGHPAEAIPSEYVKLYHEKILAYKELPMFSVISNRGCPFQCTFCSTAFKFNSLYKKEIKYHSVEWVIRELSILKKRFKIREVIFVDDTFNISKDRVLKLCEAMIKENTGIKWTCNIKAHIADAEMMRKMKEAGCWSIMMGIESGSNEVLKFIKKGVTAEQMLRVGEMADSAGIASRVSFMLGMPTDTKETIEQTINFAKKSCFHFPYFQLYIPLPGTEMFGQLKDYGDVINSDSKERSASRVNYLPRGLTQEYLLQAFKRSHKEAYLSRGKIFSHLKFIRSLDDVKRYSKGLNLLLRG